MSVSASGLYQTVLRGGAWPSLTVPGDVRLSQATSEIPPPSCLLSGVVGRISGTAVVSEEGRGHGRSGAPEPGPQRAAMVTTMGFIRKDEVILKRYCCYD